MQKKKIIEEKEPEIAALLMPQSEAKEKLKKRISLGKEFTTRNISSKQEFERLENDFRAWNNYNKEMLKRIFSTKEISDEYRHFRTRPMVMRSYRVQYTWTDDFRDLTSDLNDKIAKLEDIKGRIELFQVSSNISHTVNDKKTENLDTIKKILNRFHKVVRQLRDRYNNRSALEIEDEYDVQDLLHALLKLEFDDIRKEEWTPTYAGSSSRIDFLLKKEQIVIEVKKTSSHTKSKEIGNQLIIDTAHYKAHPDCKTLICFVYDAEMRIGNPRGLESDLASQSTPEMLVIVVIAPK